MRIVTCTCCLALAVACANAARADAEEPAASASATTAASELPLAELPALPAIELPPPSADATQELSSRLEQLAGTEVDDPLAEPDFKFLLGDLDDSMVAAIAAQLGELREDLDGKKAAVVLEKARAAGKRAIRKQKRQTKKGEEPDGDWLVFMLAARDADSDVWRGSVQLYGMLRMLEAIGTTAATRQMIASYAYFGELVRVDLQRAIERLKDKAVPALIETRQHDAVKVRRWASTQLDALGRAIPGESVSMTDPEILAEVLHAFGRTKDVEAARVILSFANSDRVQLRTAARAAIAAIGEPAAWHVKDTYKSATGEKPPASWDAKRTLQELFRLHDRARLAQVFDLWEEGAKALGAKDYSAATTAFDGVLARAPLFDRRAEMAPAYLGLAEELLTKGEADAALLALRKALRLGPAEVDKRRIQARIAVLEARQLIAKGTPDRFLLDRALELDPDNAEAKELLASLDEKREARQVEQKRYFGAIVAVLVALCAAILLQWRRSPAPPKAAPAPPPPPACEASAHGVLSPGEVPRRLRRAPAEGRRPRRTARRIRSGGHARQRRARARARRRSRRAHPQAHERDRARAEGARSHAPRARAAASRGAGAAGAHAAARGRRLRRPRGGGGGLLRHATERRADARHHDACRGAAATAGAGEAPRARSQGDLHPPHPRGLLGRAGDERRAHRPRARRRLHHHGEARDVPRHDASHGRPGARSRAPHPLPRHRRVPADDRQRLGHHGARAAG
jgi:hypothetical protein